MTVTLEPIDHPSFANACARYFASLTEDLTEAMRAKGYPRAMVEIGFRTNSDFGPSVIHLRTAPWADRGPDAFPDWHRDHVILNHLHGSTLAEMIDRARALIAQMPDVTGYAADFGSAA